MGISRKEDKEMVQAILGGELRNAWQKTNPGEGKDIRKDKPTYTRPSRGNFRDNYTRIFGHD
jgi:hypothetical protein